MKRHFHAPRATVTSKLAVCSLLAGIVLGCMAVPTVSAVFEQLQIQRTPHPIYLNGEQVELEAYAIDGYNYVKLRDIAKVMGCEVYWDGMAAHITSNTLNPTIKNLTDAISSVNEMENGIYLYTDKTTNVAEAGESVSQYTQQCRFQQSANGSGWNWYGTMHNSGSDLPEEDHWVYCVDGNCQSNLADEDSYIIQVGNPSLTGVDFLNSITIDEKEVDSVCMQNTAEGIQYTLAYSADYLDALKQQEIDALRKHQDPDPMMNALIQQQVDQLANESYQKQTLTILLDQQGALANVRLERISTLQSGTTKSETKTFQLLEHDNAEFEIYPSSEDNNFKEE